MTATEVISATQITQLNNMNRAAQKASLGTRIGQLNKFTETVAFDDFTDGGGTTGTYVITAGSIPVGATFLFSAITAITGFTGDPSTATITIGDGTDADRYNTGTPSVYATAAAGVSVGSPSGVLYHAAAKDITLTVTAASDFAAITAGSLTISFYYLA